MNKYLRKAITAVKNPDLVWKRINHILKFIFKMRLTKQTIYFWGGSFGDFYKVSSSGGTGERTMFFLMQRLNAAGIALERVASFSLLPRNMFLFCFDVPSKDNLKKLANRSKNKNILFLWEPPSVKPENYDVAFHEPFSKVFTWNDDLVDNKKYFKFFYPQPDLNVNSELNFIEKKLCAMVAYNKTSNHENELYSERKTVIDFYENKSGNDFDLYGRGWERCGYKNYKGSVVDKIETLKNYKFNYCYENIKDEKGYVSEKLFDSFVAGVVPIYLGALNVQDYVPQECFISRNDFQSLEELHNYISSMSQNEYELYLKNIKNFIESDKSKFFSWIWFANLVIESLDFNLNIQKVFQKSELQLINRLKDEVIKINRASFQGAYRSQYGQDRFVYETFFKNKSDGVFVDIGATDGETISNTFFFEKSLGWKGICAEPRGSVFNKLSDKRNCVCFNGCITDFNGETEFLEIDGYSQDLSGIVKSYDSRHLQRIETELENYGGASKKIKTKCRRLNDLLKENNFARVDYLSLDIEGGELDVLKGINFDDVFIDVIDVENNYKDSRIKDYLMGQGYELVSRIACDEIYRKI
ncbi:MAG: hypothetical protein UR26_C0001G0132 [candidate division TM6 bacterium GW2011_GWF2_32_72]|nr:MAG: hypothetical protein UR26_C0001G0132 [candidate division TM6 bacterium GW2011_GWF2_32_72]